MEKEEEIEKVSWHQGFCSGLELELREYKDVLEFDTEHELSRRPLRMDLLVIRRKDSRAIENPIGAFFRGHNIIEYKSPDDGLDIDDFYKVIGYAGIYKSLGKHVNEIPAEDMTISIFRHRYPRKLIQMLKEAGADIVYEAPGIYRIDGIFYIPIRIIVTRQLGAEYAVLRILAKGITSKDIRSFNTQMDFLRGKDDQENIKAVLEVSTAVNEEAFHRAREVSDMGPGIYNLFREDIEKSKYEGETKGRKEEREFILKDMVSLGMITQDQADAYRNGRLEERTYEKN
ncbi:MAG: hypothetical protein IKQ97_08145 [Eubacterium sp.]|nr:hypothetical protein [Eubacterium sp.]